VGWIEAGDRFEDALQSIEDFFGKAWSDGLPVVPPTEARIEAMLRGTRSDPDALLGDVPPLGGPLTVRDLAVHAVLAGCLPEYMPILVAIFRAVLQPRFNLLGVQATTHGSAPLAIVGGPAARAVGMNSGHNVFGSGNRANATMGRAVRLVLLNVGGGIPERGDKSTQGHPGKYTFCIAESETVAPWRPLHQELGVDSASGVTVFGCEAPHSVVVNGEEGATILDGIASSLATLCNNAATAGGEVLIVHGAEHAAQLHREGWSRQDVRSYLHERARIPLRELVRIKRRVDNIADLPRWVMKLYDRDRDYRMPVPRYAANIHLTVAGGQGPFSSVLPGWGYMGGFACAAPIE
jgi:hypothetical protein